MPRLMMVGTSHHQAPVEMRERLAIDEAAWRACQPPELPTILLSTCNRVEVYAWVDRRTDATRRSLVRSLSQASGVPLTEMQQNLTCRVGRDAVLHLVRVTCGLDSLLVGEEQIRGQVRNALQAAEASLPLPASLRGVFQRAIESARRVRGATFLGRVPSIAATGVTVARRAVPGDVDGKIAVVLGAGVMARAAAEALLSAGARVHVLNRTPEHAQRLMANLRNSISVDSLDALPRALGDAAIVVGATAARTAVVDLGVVESVLPARRQPLVLLDIALPRDVDPRVRHLAGVKLIDLDDLERLCPVDSTTRHVEQDRAEALAVDEAARVETWLRSRAVSPAIAELRTYAESIRAAELRRSAARLRDLTPDQIAAVDALTNSIVNKLMHGPTVALRDAASRPTTRSRILRVLRPRSSRGRSA